MYEEYETHNGRFGELLEATFKGETSGITVLEDVPFHLPLGTQRIYKKKILRKTNMALIGNRKEGK